MTSISQKQGLQPQGQSTASQAASPSVAPSGKTVPPSSSTSTAPRSYASAATKKSATDSTAAPVTVDGPAQHGKSALVSPVNGKPMQQSQSPGVTIVNGAPASASTQAEHIRKPSVTITSAGASGYMPNGAAPTNRPNSLQFGSLNQQSSPNMGGPAVLASQPQPSLGVASSPVNPRVTSPQTSPAPIPQPTSSGGRPPSTYQSQGNGPSFGSFGEMGETNMRHQGPLAPGPQASHLRRESSQSTHSDVGNHIANGPGRGGYPHQGGRGRGYSQSGYQGQMPYSPGPNYRSTPNQPRGGHNMGHQFHGHNQGRPPLGHFPNSPHQSNRSPALANAHPVTPQMNQVPMAPSQIPPQHYAYGQHMGPQPVRNNPFPSSRKSLGRSQFSKRKNGTRVFSSPQLPPIPKLPSLSHPSYSSSNTTVSRLPPNLAPESGHFEQFLMLMKNNQGYTHAYDPSYGYYNPAYAMPQIQYMTPPSPQPRPGIPFNGQAPYMQNQFPVQQPPPVPQAAPLARSPSQVSNDRPGSSLGQGQAPSIPVTSGHAHTTSRSSNSPAPTKSQFVIPPKKSPITIRDPGSGAVKTFDKTPASPARATPSPVKVSSPAPTPPPQSGSEAGHARTESKSTKTVEEKKKALRDAVLQKIEQDEAEQRKKVEEDLARQKKEQAEEAERKKKEEEESARRKKEEEEAAERKKKEEEEAARKKKEEGEEAERKAKEAEAKAAEEPKKAPEPASAPADDEIDYDAIERELAEIEAKEAAAEAEYQRKKQAEKEEKARKEKEEREAWEANMKNAEREAEALEEAKLKKQQVSAEDQSSKELFASIKKGGFQATQTATPTESYADSLAVSDTSMGPPGKPASATKRDKPAALKLETTKSVEPPQPSAAMKALHSARFVEDLTKISYPASIVSPNPALNENAPADRKFHYNKEFLLQFQNIFKEKPSVDWDVRVKETVGEGDASRPQSARTPGMGSRSGSRPGIPQTFDMGKFGQPSRGYGLPPGTTSDQRFAMSEQRLAMSNAARTASMGGNPFTFGPRGLGMTSPAMSRTNSATAIGAMAGPGRVPSGSRTGTGSRRGKKKEDDSNKAMPLTAGKELKALTVSATGWKPRSVGQAVAGPTPGGERLSPEVVQRKVKAALNKMTPENFDRISGQILEIVSQSKDESDGRTLRQVIQLTFEKATDEAHWAPMYAKFCKRMLESMSPEIKDESIHDKNGNVVTGGSLFRKYLLNRCQEEFERGWKVNLPPKPEGNTEEAAMMSDEYYAAAAAKRRGLGLVKFIGELYKLGMLTERIMHECVKKLVDYEGVPEEAEVESLTSLLRTIGASLDASEKGHTFMDAYFVRINMMMQTPDLPSRLRFMLMDIVDLRTSRWISKDSDKGPKTIHEIREEAARAQQEAEMERLRQQANRGGRPAMGRGDARNFSGYGNQVPPQDFASSKVGSDDLRRLRTTRTSNQPMSFGPSSMLGSRSNSGRRNLGPGGNLVRGSDDSGASSRTGTPTGKKEEKEATSSINAFSALASLEDMATSPPSNPTSPSLMKAVPAVERRLSKTPSKDGENTA